MDSLPRLPSVSAAPATPAASPGAAKSGESDFKQVLERLAQHIDDGEQLVRQATAPAGDGADRLIALQAGIYRYTEVVDLTAKLVDRGTNSIKTTLQSQ